MPIIEPLIVLGGYAVVTGAMAAGTAKTVQRGIEAHQAASVATPAQKSGTMEKAYQPYTDDMARTRAMLGGSIYGKGPSV